MAYFTAGDLRAEFTELASASKYPDAKIEEVRDRAQDAFEDAAGVAFEPRTSTETISGNGRREVVLRRPKIRSLTSITDETGATVSTSDVRATVAGMYRSGGWPRGVSNLNVTYEHGYDQAPARVKQAVMLLTKVWLIKGPLDDRVTSLSTEDGTFALLTPGVRGSVFGIPEVDATLSQYRMPVIA